MKAPQMPRFKFQLSRQVKVMIMVGMVFVSIGFVEKRQADRVCNRIVIQVDNQYENFFIDESDVMALMTEGGKDFIVGSAYKNIDLRHLEQRIEEHRFIQNAEVFHDPKGNLLVRAKQSRPIARLVRSHAPDAYVSDLGQILPVSERYTARVLLISGSLVDSLITRDLSSYRRGRRFFEFLEYINNDPFWSAQIAQIDIEPDGEMNFYTTVSKQLVEFGTVENYQDKFQRLHIFYKRILPQKGWNEYERVSLKFKGQIVCE
ncbi:MAG: cell division protein FtsQ [Cytophagales bacterium]|nr:cell division protein FtsQ [Cytophagales bacterium]